MLFVHRSTVHTTTAHCWAWANIQFTIPLIHSIHYHKHAHCHTHTQTFARHIGRWQINDNSLWRGFKHILKVIENAMLTSRSLLCAGRDGLRANNNKSVKLCSSISSPNHHFLPLLFLMGCDFRFLLPFTNSLSWLEAILSAQRTHRSRYVEVISFVLAIYFLFKTHHLCLLSQQLVALAAQTLTSAEHSSIVQVSTVAEQV